MQNAHPAFTLLRTQAIPSLNIVVEEYEHRVTGAQHVHLIADNPENVFLVALRTVPEDSTGVAHILEHTALCGSKRYPVRDPFFMMTRRSLNTFMNAFTSSDWTAYPFASVNRKDFNNLLDVYLDAVFFSRLDPLDFAQEGHRLEFAEPDDPASPLVHKGVVYNEMKGAMSSISSLLWHTINKYRHPATTYHYNSGGDPECITDLTYEQLVAFYKTHYHPSNAIFMTYGDIPAAELQDKFETLALSQFTKLEDKITVADEKRFYAPINIEESYAIAESEYAEDKSHVVMGWLLGQTNNLEDALTAHLLSSVLLDNSASPLLHVLETSTFGNGPSPMCGLDDSQKEMTFLCGLEGCKSSDAEAIEALIMECLEKIALNGVPQADIESALHQLELHQREIGGDSYPYGLQIILNSLTAATHRGDPVAILDVDGALNTLRDAIADPEFIKNQVRSMLLDNAHRVRLTLKPDTKMNQRKEDAIAAELARVKASLSQEEIQTIVNNAAILKERQVKVDDAEILPKVTLKDVPLTESHQTPKTHVLANSGSALTTYDVGSNGLVYQQIVIETPELDDDLAQYLPYYTSCATEVGVGDKDYLAVQKWQAAVSGGFNAFNTLRSQVSNIHKTHRCITFSGKALNRNHRALSEMMLDTLNAANFDAPKRVRELIAQMRAGREQSITSNGHSLAMTAATAGMCAASKISHDLGGLEGTRKIKALDASMEDESFAKSFCESLNLIHLQVSKSARQFLLVGETHEQPKLQKTFKEVFDKAAASSSQNDWELPYHCTRVQEGWLTNSQVNFCAKAYPTVPMTHPDAAPLVILGNVLRNGYLHRAIREQGGAYGGGAGQDNNSASFRFYSYRDPRLAETLVDFDKSIQWLLETTLKWQAVEEAILGTISGIDKPDSPAGRAKRLFHADLHGRTLAIRQTFREQLLSTTIDELKRVASSYFAPEKASVAVVTDFSKEGLVKDLGLEVIKL